MPRRVEPKLPEGAVTALDALGSPLKVAVARSLATEGPASRAELARRLEVSASTLKDALRSMTEAGVLSTDPSRLEPGPVTRRYVFERTRATELLTALRDAVLAG